MVDVTVRHATPADKGRLMVMARDFHAASGLHLPFSGPAVSLVVDACIAHPDRLMLVLDSGGQARGFLAAEVGMHPFTAAKIATELAWWVEPALRGRAALGMLRAYEDWARERRCTAVHLAGLGGDPAVSAIYRRRGFQPVETHFLKTL